MGEGSIGEALFALIELGGGEKSFASSLAAAVVVVALHVELSDEGVVLLEGEEREVVFAVYRFTLKVFDELASSALAFHAVDLRPSENEGMEGVCLPRRKGDDVLAFHLWEVAGVELFSGEGALPVHVHGDATLANEAATDD